MTAALVQEITGKVSSGTTGNFNFTTSTPVSGNLVIVSVQGYRDNGQDADITVAGYGVTTWNSFHIAANASTEYGWSHLAWGWVDGTPTKNGTVTASGSGSFSVNATEWSGVPSTADTFNSPATVRQRSVSSTSIDFDSQSDTYLLYVTESEDSSELATSPGSPWTSLTSVGTPGGADQLNSSSYLVDPGSGTKTATFTRPSSDSFYLVGVQFDTAAAPTGPTVSVTVPDSASIGDEVDVSASAIPGDGTISSYLWTFTSAPSGSSAAFDDDTASDTSFTPDVAGAYVCQCTVTDSNDLTASDSGTCTVSNPASAPVLVNHKGGVINLSGTPMTIPETTPGNILIFVGGAENVTGDEITPSGGGVTTWVKATGSPFDIALPTENVRHISAWSGVVDSASTSVSYTASGYQSGGAYVTEWSGLGEDFTLTLTGSAIADSTSPTLGATIPDECLVALVSMMTGNNYRGTSGTETDITESLAGVLSQQYVIQPDAGTRNIGWTLSTSDQAAMTLLAVTGEGDVTHTPPSVTVDVPSVGTVDVAVDVSASATPGDGAISSYAWTFTSRPSGSSAAFDDATAASTSFTPDVTGSYVVKCTVTDANSLSDDDSGTCVVSDLTGPSVVVTVPDTARVGSAVTVTADATEGSGTIDSDSGYLWTISSAPTGSSADIASGQGTDSATFVPDRSGDYTITCEITDSNDLTASDSGDLTAKAGVKVYNGSNWVDGVKKTYNGSGWV